MMRLSVLSALLVATTASANEPVVPDAEAEVPPVATQAPIVLPEHVVVTSAEPMGRGDDRVARRLEELLEARSAALSACRDVAVAQGREPLRFEQLHVQFQADGSLKKTKVSSSTGDPEVDACVQQLVAGLVLDPPPQFPDKLEVNVTWRKPKADGT